MNNKEEKWTFIGYWDLQCRGQHKQYPPTSSFAKSFQGYDSCHHPMQLVLNAYSFINQCHTVGQ